MILHKIFCVRHAGDCVRLQVVKNLDVIDTFSKGVRKSLATVRTLLAKLLKKIEIRVHCAKMGQGTHLKATAMMQNRCFFIL